MRSLLVLFAVTVASAKPADACAVGSPCTKYKHMYEPSIVQVTPSIYTRHTGTAFRSFTRSRVVAFLTGAQWDPVIMPVALKNPYQRVIQPVSVRFVEAERATRTLQSTRQRVVLIRRIEYRNGVTMIEVDNDIYALQPCDGKKRMCLSLRNDLSFDAPVADDVNFAQPPVEAKL